MMRGRELIADIDACRVSPGGAALWWLGQHGFVLKLPGVTLYIDPFLSELSGRQVPPLLRGDEVTNADLILGSHDHVDHIDRDVWPAIAAASPRARFVVPELLRAGLAEQIGLPPERVLGVDETLPLVLGGVKISAVAAAHEFLDTDPATGLHPYLGFVIESEGFCLYHAGDCCNYEGLLTRLRSFDLDACILPINGRDARRLRGNCIGNMTYQEAADLAGALAPGVVIPAHYEMFAFNSASAADFAEYVAIKHPRQRVEILHHGERVFLQGGSGGGVSRRA